MKTWNQYFKIADQLNDSFRQEFAWNVLDLVVKCQIPLIDALGLYMAGQEL